MHPALKSRSNLLCVSGVAVLALVGAAAAQTALGDGRGLERNPQVGSGGRNVQRPSVQDQIRLNNAIITGNAPDGRSFRGSVGYRATNDFGGRAPSDDLYAFRRDSSLSGLFGAGVRGTDALRYQFALSTGQSLPSGFARSNLYVSRESAVSGGTNASSGAAPAAVGALRSTAEFTTLRSIRPALVGERIDTQGYEWTAQSSPLTGINWTRSTNPVVRVGPPVDPQARFDLGADPTTTDPLPLGSRFVPGATGFESSATGIGSVLDRDGLRDRDALRRRSDRGAASPAVTRVHDKVLTAFASPIDSRVPLPAANGAAAQPEASQSGTSQPGTSPTGAPRSTETPDTEKAAQPADRSLDAVLERFRRSLRGEPNTPASGAQPITPGDAFKPRPMRQPGATDQPSALPMPSDGRVGEPRPESRPSETGSRPQTDSNGKPADNRPLTANEALTPDIVRSMRAVGEIKLDTLALRPVDPGAVRVTDETAYFSHMQAGEQALLDGRYFHAEDRFTRAIAAMPGDPMARVGRVHAQLGAGLYLSAAANLRSVFTEHPELIGLTYGPALVPNNKRADRIADALRGNLRKEIPVLDKESAFLLAYLGQIRQDAPVVQEGLLEMTKRWNIEDPAEAALLEALRAAWAKNIEP